MINQSDDYPGMAFLDAAFDSSTFFRNSSSSSASTNARETDDDYNNNTDDDEATENEGACGGLDTESSRRGGAGGYLRRARSNNNNNNNNTYCSKTRMYCEAVSRALDMRTCRVVPFFGTFLHDLRFIIETVPSVAIMCNPIVQKPIEVNIHAIYVSRFFVVAKESA